MYVQHSPSPLPLGAYSRRGFTIEYYANPGSLEWKDRGLKRLYEGMRNADFAWQKALNEVATKLDPLWEKIEEYSEGKLKKRNITAALRLKLPVALPALILEIVGGKRPLDESFRGFARMAAQEADQAVGMFGVLTGINLTLSALSAVIVPLEPLLPLLGTIAGVAFIAAILARIVGDVAKQLAREKLPPKAQFKEMLETSAFLAGEPKPTSKQIDDAYAALEEANKSGRDVSAQLEKVEKDSKKQPPKKTRPRGARASGVGPGQSRQPETPTPGAGVPPALLGAGALALVAGVWFLLQD